MENISKKNGVKFGVLLAIYYLIYNSVLFFINPTLFTQPVYGIVSMVVVLILGVLCVFFTKKDYQNYITLKQAFSAYLIMISIGFVFNNLLLYVFFNFIKPEYIEINKNILMELAEKNLRAAGGSVQDIDNQLEIIKNTNHYNFQTIFYSIAQSIVFGSIAGLLISLTFRNNSELSKSKQTNS